MSRRMNLKGKNIIWLRLQ